MGFFSNFFGNKPEDLLRKGEKQLAEGSFYEARCSFEDGLACCQNKSEHVHLKDLFERNIAAANLSLALLNIDVARHAASEGNHEKVLEHLELAKTLTSHEEVREKADLLLASIGEKSNNKNELDSASGCSSCTTCTPHDESFDAKSGFDEIGLDVRVHYELLIHQLPEEMFERYSSLGEDFACMYIAASHDDHEHALDLLEAWHVPGKNDDIYLNEKGKILHRLGRVAQSEECFKSAISCNSGYHLPYLGLALLLLEESRFDEAGVLLDEMIAANIFKGQSTMMRAEVFQVSGDMDRAVELFASLLNTPLAKAAAGKLYEILQFQNRHAEAAALYKQYLKSCGH